MYTWSIFLKPFINFVKFLVSLWSRSDSIFSSSTEPSNQKTNGHVVHKKGVKSLEDVPGPRPSLPFLGTMWVYWFGSYDLKKLHEANFDKFHKYGKVMKEEFQYGCPLVQIFDPKDIETVMKHQGRCPLRPANEAVVHFRRSCPERYASLGLVNAQGEEWNNLRCKLNPVLLRQKVINQYLPSLNDVADDFCSLLRSLRDENNNVNNIISTLYRFALESVVMLCLDTRLGCLDTEIQLDSEAQLMIDTTTKIFEAYQELYYNLPLWKYYETANYKKMVDAESTAYNIASKYIDRAMEQVRELQESSCLNPEESGLTILMSLLSRQDMDQKDIRMIMVDAIVAGIDTVSNSLVFALYQLANNPEVQEKLYQEIENVLPACAPITAQNVQHLPYLKACIRESFRISPTIPSAVRILQEDIVLQDYLIPKGVPICCHTMVTSRLPQYFDEPDKFMPERWLGKDDLWNSQYSVLPFGSGPRACVGRRFAEQELYTSVAKIIQNFEVRSVSSEPLECIYRFMVIPDRPLTFTFNDR